MLLEQCSHRCGVAQLERAPLARGGEHYPGIMTWGISYGWPDVIRVQVPAPQHFAMPARMAMTRTLASI